MNGDIKMAVKTKAALLVEINSLHEEIAGLKEVIEAQKIQIEELKKVQSRGAGRKTKITQEVVDKVLDMYQFFPYTEISKKVGLSLGTVHKIIHSDFNL
jgi:hypothetical protein